MANDFEYLEEEAYLPWETGGDEVFDEDVQLLLHEWGISKSPLLDQLETWYDKAHVGAFDAQTECTGKQLRFERLKKEWIKETRKLSVLSQIVIHPAYQQIMAIGPEVIPFILQALQKDLNHWFWALKNLNEGDDVAEGAQSLSEAAKAWIKWGRDKGHLKF